MTYYDEQLQALQSQAEEKRRLDVQLQELYAQREALAQQAEALESAMLREQADVDRLEGGSLASFFYNVVGKRDERLNKEREEAYAARVKYDAAAQELSGVEEDIRRREARAAQLSDAERRYDELLREKGRAIKAAGTLDADEILALEARIAYLESQKQEIYEALVAGENALHATDDVLAELGHAEGWGVADLVSDGGFLFAMAKHSHLDSAQAQIQTLQARLRAFKTELADVASIRAELQVNLDGFLRFADYFFDNLFTDWMVMDRIGRSKSQVESTAGQIVDVLQRLEAIQSDLDVQLRDTRTQLAQRIRSAPI